MLTQDVRRGWNWTRNRPSGGHYCVRICINAGDSDGAEAMRDLVETVTVFRDTSRSGGVEVEIAGRLTALLGAPAYPNGVKGVWGKVVAEEGLEPPTQGL